jgi:diacylglycerol kinase family enzyme
MTVRTDCIPVLRNQAAGGGGADDDLLAVIDRAGLPAHVREVPPTELAAEARRLVEAGARVVGVSGGDGTVSTVAGALVGTDAALAVFPGGTLNHFAHALGIATHGDAVRAVTAGRVERVDVGEVNGRVFVNGASIGLYPRQLRLRRAWQPRIGKWPAAAVAGLLTMAGFPRRRLTLEGAGLYRVRTAPLVWIGPGRGSFRDPVTAPRELRSGVLELVVVGAGSRLRLVEIGIRAALAGRDGLKVAEEARDCDVHVGARFTLSAPRARRMDVGVDGELVRLPAPLEFRLLPAALRVLVPPHEEHTTPAEQPKEEGVST